MFVTFDELESMLNDNFVISSSVVSVANCDNDYDEYLIDYKLFNLFTIS